MALPTERLPTTAQGIRVTQFPGHGAVITPDDNTDIANPGAALYVGNTGDVTVVMLGDLTTTLFKAVPAGTTLPIAVRRVMSTGTTSTSITAIWQ